MSGLIRLSAFTRLQTVPLLLSESPIKNLATPGRAVHPRTVAIMLDPHLRMRAAHDFTFESNLVRAKRVDGGELQPGARAGSLGLRSRAMGSKGAARVEVRDEPLSRRGPQYRTRPCTHGTPCTGVGGTPALTFPALRRRRSICSRVSPSPPLALGGGPIWRTPNVIGYYQMQARAELSEVSRGRGRNRGIRMVLRGGGESVPAAPSVHDQQKNTSHPGTSGGLRVVRAMRTREGGKESHTRHITAGITETVGVGATDMWFSGACFPKAGSYGSKNNGGKQKDNNKGLVECVPSHPTDASEYRAPLRLATPFWPPNATHEKKESNHSLIPGSKTWNKQDDAGAGSRTQIHCFDFERGKSYCWAWFHQGSFSREGNW
ncbi:hypothetical protein K438DRAFT_2169322 [Mycena galopus ATCC 62051]|nr:hypothetical protein K438DRAFT_2169322 [Mycena galopus ATCC 62051]